MLSTHVQCLVHIIPVRSLACREFRGRQTAPFLLLTTLEPNPGGLLVALVREVINGAIISTGQLISKPHLHPFTPWINLIDENVI